MTLFKVSVRSQLAHFQKSEFLKQISLHKEKEFQIQNLYDAFEDAWARLRNMPFEL